MEIAVTGVDKKRIESNDVSVDAVGAFAGVEVAMSRQLQLEFPTEGEAFDQKFGTEPTIIPVSDIMIFIYRKATE